MFAKSTALAAAIAVSATSAFAGGLSPEIVETAVMEDAMVAPAGPSIDPSFIVLGVIAALLIATAVNDDDDEPEREDDEKDINRIPPRLIIGDGGDGGDGGAP